MGRKDKGRRAEGYRHPEASALLRPDVGTQAQFRKKKKPATYRYDSSLSPALDWDGQNPARELAEAKITALQECIARLAASIGEGDAGGIADGDLAVARKELAAARAEVDELQALSKPFLNWAGKAERLSFEVPTLPLFVHERLSTAAIVETLKGHTRDRQTDMFDLFGESDLPIHDRLLKAYEHRDGWVNRLVLGDSLVVMNSLVHYEGLGGQVQTIYMDPPYAVKFGSNSQPFVRKRDVTHGADDDMVREPEMVQAYRDTWELGVHSFLTYLRDRLLMARELLHPSGSIFVQMSDTNLHHVREVMDEVFGAECFVSQISFQTTSGFQTRTLATLGDFLLWYARDPERLKVRKLFEERGNLWTDTLTGSFTDEKMYVVQTNPKVVERCLLMTSEPGDLVLDPTCGSGITTWCAEKWGRRWITCDTSRVPVALARQRMLTGTFDFFRLQEPERGPAGGFQYRRKQNRKGEEMGGIVPHITLESIANQEPAKEEVLVDRPEKDDAVTRISGPFCVEATIPTPVDWEGDGEEDSGDLAAVDAYVDHVERMIERPACRSVPASTAVRSQGRRRPWQRVDGRQVPLGRMKAQIGSSTVWGFATHRP